MPGLSFIFNRLSAHNQISDLLSPSTRSDAGVGCVLVMRGPPSWI